jgi:AcrR family transcriptional regulator
MRDGTRTRARIETEALRLFASKGVDGTSIRDIAEAVGVAEGALYRHFSGKDTLSRQLFHDNYAALAREILATAERNRIFPETVRAIIAIFCRLFDDNRPLFAYLLITQHAFLYGVPDNAEDNVVEAIRHIFARAMEQREIRTQDANQLAAMALGIVAQPAIFTIYGRLTGPLSERAPVLTEAVLALAHVLQ